MTPQNEARDRPPTTHTVKCIPPFFEEVWSGRKLFEVRLNDRDYREGDEIVQREYLPAAQEFTGRETAHRVGYVLRDYPALAADHVAFALLPLSSPAPAVAAGVEGAIHSALKGLADGERWFREYAEHHAAKSDPEKAARNEERANRLRSAANDLGVALTAPAPSLGLEREAVEQAFAEALADVMADSPSEPYGVLAERAVAHAMDGLALTAPSPSGCQTCGGQRRIHVVAGACTPAHDEDCPTCVGRLVGGVRIFSVIPR